MKLPLPMNLVENENIYRQGIAVPNDRMLMDRYIDELEIFPDMEGNVYRYKVGGITGFVTAKNVVQAQGYLYYDYEFWLPKRFFTKLSPHEVLRLERGYIL